MLVPSIMDVKINTLTMEMCYNRQCTLHFHSRCQYLSMPQAHQPYPKNVVRSWPMQSAKWPPVSGLTSTSHLITSVSLYLGLI